MAFCGFFDGWMVAAFGERFFSGGNCLRAAFVVGLLGFVRGGGRGIEADFHFFSWVYVEIGGQGE